MPPKEFFDVPVMVAWHDIINIPECIISVSFIITLVSILLLYDLITVLILVR